jgi:nicotinamidase-related amidase
MSRHPHLLTRDGTVLVVVDVQERLAAVMEYREPVVANIRRLIQAARLLVVPLVVTEQYPKGLGPTVPELRELLAGEKVLEKLTFSCCGLDPFLAELERLQAKKLLVVGMETHVCVLQTVLDCLAAGYLVHVPNDAVCSRFTNDWRTGLARMAAAGAILTTTETALFELLERAGTDEFREARKWIVNA